ncbi:prepilin peptidase, partial [Arcanobacterium phocae]
MEFLLDLFTTGFVFAWGACVGSFLNVVVYRLPNGVSIVHPPS